LPRRGGCAGRAGHPAAPVRQARGEGAPAHGGDAGARRRHRGGACEGRACGGAAARGVVTTFSSSRRGEEEPRVSTSSRTREQPCMAAPRVRPPRELRSTRSAFPRNARESHMQSTGFAHWLVVLVETFAALFVLLLAVAVVVIAAVWVVDRNQASNAVLRNFPVIGHFRYGFLRLGEFFRQYLFSSDREELPFNRAQRVWVYRAAKNAENTNAFGSTRDLRGEGVPFFVNAAFPALGDHHVEPKPVRIGPHAREPYDHAAFFNISAMSFGALGAPAVRALSHGAAKAGIWMDTGEGGLAPYHLEGGCDI